MQWHPAFLEMGQTLDECAAHYRYCIRYTPPKKEAKPYHWGSRLPRYTGFRYAQLAGREKPRLGRGYQRAGQLQFGFVHRCQVSRSPESKAMTHTFQQANRATSTFAWSRTEMALAGKLPVPPAIYHFP